MTRVLSRDPRNPGALPPSLAWIMGLCAAAFVLQVAGGLSPLLDLRLVDRFALVPALVLRWPAPQLWRPVTYLFLHGGVSHLLFNLFALWMFGVPVVAEWGDRAFLRYFFLCGLGAAAAQLALLGRSTSATIGLSGAVYGLLVAFAMMHPDAVVYVYFLIPMRARTMAVVFAALEFFAGATDARPGIASFAHFGGMLTGYLYLRWWFELKRRARALLGGAA